VWSVEDERKLVEYAVQYSAKGGDGMNFTKSFWIGAATEMATHSCPDSAPKTPEACQSKWAWVNKKMYQVVDKISSASGLSFGPDLEANISKESETMWADFIKILYHLSHNPLVKPLKNKGWPHYEMLQGIILAQTSSWVGFHASTSLAADASTPTATGSDITHATSSDTSADPMSSLESVPNQVEFCDLDDIEMSRAPAATPIPISPVTGAPIPPVTP
ncbi:hypothetical protein BDR07DRAFT_1302992, partial [Suillus spraguei]